MRKGTHNPIGVSTLPLDPLRMKRSEHLTSRTVGPHTGHREVSVNTRQAACGDA